MIPVNEPLISQNALRYVSDCVKSGWISSAGDYIKRFEEKFAEYIGVKYAVTTTSGTTALHLALASLDVGDKDEVIIPALTMIAVPFAVIYTGASCVPVDVDPVIYNICPKKIENVIKNSYEFKPNKKELVNKHTGKRLKAIIPVHLYGHPCDMSPIIQLARKYNLRVIEDAAEAHGAEYLKDINGNTSNNTSCCYKAGSMGDIGCFSFYGNKIITTGEGGMLVTNNDSIAERARRLKDMSHSPSKRFSHTEVGFNYRMTNLQAAIGLAQLEEINKYLSIKRKMAEKYNILLANIKGLFLPEENKWAKSVYWMYAVLVEPDFGMTRDVFMKRLKEKGVDTRTFFVPMDEQPAFNKENLFKFEDWPVSRNLSKKGLYLPSGLTISEKIIEKICESIIEIKNFA